MVSIIVAMTRERIIGNNGKLPWDIPEELNLFRATTRDSTVIMGRKTFESIGRPLPDRNNIVVSKKLSYVTGVDVCRSVEEAVEKAKTYKTHIRGTFVIGGADVYKEALDKGLVEEMDVSWVKRNYPGDVKFPYFDMLQWIATEPKDYAEFEHVVYLKRS